MKYYRWIEGIAAKYPARGYNFTRRESERNTRKEQAHGWNYFTESGFSREPIQGELSFMVFETVRTIVYSHRYAKYKRKDAEFAWQTFQREWASHRRGCLERIKVGRKETQKRLENQAFHPGGDEPLWIYESLQPGRAAFYGWNPDCIGAIVINTALKPSDRLKAINVLKEARERFEDIQGPVKIYLWLNTDWEISDPIIHYEAAKPQEVA